MRKTNPASLLLSALVLGHLVVAIVHGAAHQGAGVTLAPLPNAFVLIVIMAGPLVGLALNRSVAPRSGAWIVAASMGGALVFGLVNHFIMRSPDHVMQVAEPWRMMFGVTAALLFVFEAAACWAAVRCATLRNGARQLTRLSPEAGA